MFLPWVVPVPLDVHDVVDDVDTPGGEREDDGSGDDAEPDRAVERVEVLEREDDGHEDDELLVPLPRAERVDDPGEGGCGRSVDVQ